MSYFKLIENGEIYRPDPAGSGAVLVAGDKILRVWVGRDYRVEREKLLAFAPNCQLIDAAGCVVVPGLLDPHAHLAGAGGEQGFASRTGPLDWSELVQAGVTTVVGCLGTDTISRTQAELYARVQQLRAGGLSAYMYTGGFPVPPATLTSSVEQDLTLIESVIGLGEIAIADLRSLNPTGPELARLVSQALVGGKLAGKSGLTHFHVGEASSRLKLLRALLDEYELEPRYLYPTHIGRTPELMDEAIELAHRGAWVDLDTVDEKLGYWLTYYRSHDGPLDKLTISSDSRTQGGSPAKFFGQFVNCLREYGFSLAELLPCLTRNTAQVLGLPAKGELNEGRDADILVLDKTNFAPRHLLARGQQLLRDGQIVQRSKEKDGV